MAASIHTPIMKNGANGNEIRMQAVVTYRDLRVWQLGMDLVEQCYLFTRSFPREETYGLTSQLRRAAVSIPSNIAEGYGREHRTEYVRFLQMATGSLREVETLLAISVRVGISNEQSVKPLNTLCDNLGRGLWSLMRALERPAAQE